jgi:hypothetical protein
MASISSLGRALAAPSLREPVAPLSVSEQRAVTAPKTSTPTELRDAQVVTDVEKTLARATDPRAESKRAAQRPAQTSAQSATAASAAALAPATSTPSFQAEDVASAVEQFQSLMQRNRVEFSATGPLSRPELTIVDHVNNIDFERDIPPEALKEMLFELRMDFQESLKSDHISVDNSTPFSSRVVVIKESINSVEFVRHLPYRYNQERLDALMTFASEQGFSFEAVA